MAESNKAKAIISEYGRLDGLRKPILIDYDRIARYVLPSHAYFLEEKFIDSNQDKYIEVFDTTAMRANEVLAAFFHGAVTPPNAQWFNLRARNKDKDRAHRDYFEKQQEKMTEALQESNFITSVAQFYLDYGAFNTAAVSVYDESNDLAFGRLKFTNMHLSKVVFREGISGKPEFVWFKQTWSAINATVLFPDADMPKVKEAAEEDKTKHKDFDFIVYCEPIIENNVFINRYETTIVSVEDRTEVQTDEEVATPFLIARFQQATGQVWGTGPGLRALPDILTINRAKELELEGWEEDINGGFKTTPDNLVDGEIYRKGITVCEDINELQQLREGGVNWSVAQIKGEELQNSIRSMFYEDRLVMQSSGGDTATEFRIRYDLLQRQLAPAMGRLQTEFLNPLIERVFDLMLKGGALDPLPEDLLDDDLDIEFISPISKAQRLPEVEAINQWLSIIAGLTQLYPELRHLADAENAMREVADVLSVPSEAIRDPKAYKEAVEKEQEQIQQAREAEAQAQQQGQPNA